MNYLLAFLEMLERMISKLKYSIFHTFKPESVIEKVFDLKPEKVVLKITWITDTYAQLEVHAKGKIFILAKETGYVMPFICSLNNGTLLAFSLQQKALSFMYALRHSKVISEYVYGAANNQSYSLEELHDKQERGITFYK